MSVHSMGAMTTSPSTPPLTSAPSSGAAERADLVDVLRKHRTLFRRTLEGLTDEQARLTPTVSALSLGGLVKHVAATEQHWASFIVDGPAPPPDVDWANVDWANPPPHVRQYADGFRMLEDETARRRCWTQYEQSPAATDELLPRRPRRAPAAARGPWFEPGARWSARRSSRTSWPRPHSTRVTPTSCARPSTARRNHGLTLRIDVPGRAARRSTCGRDPSGPATVALVRSGVSFDSLPSR